MRDNDFCHIFKMLGCIIQAKNIIYGVNTNFFKLGLKRVVVVYDKIRT